MYRKKKISDISEPTQAQRPKRFIRQNSYCSLQCRSRSTKRLSVQKDIPKDAENMCQFTVELPMKMQTESMKINPKMEKELQKTKKQFSASMKTSRKRINDLSEAMPTLEEQLALSIPASDELSALRSQYKKLKVYFNQQRERRKNLEEQSILNKQEIKRLEKRLDKYKKEIEKLDFEGQTMAEHIKELELKGMSDQQRQLQSYRVKYLEEQVNRLKTELQKSKSTRQKQLVKHVDKLVEQKYTLQKELNAAIVGRDAITKQLEDTQKQLQEIKTTVHQKAIRSVEYIQLRERYRLLLVQTRWLKQEIDHLERDKGQRVRRGSSESQAILETLLTVSEDSLYME